MGVLQDAVNSNIVGATKCVHYYEALVLMAVLHFLAKVDQMDITQSVGCELLHRRVALIFKVCETAKETGLKPDWSIADTFLGCPLLNQTSGITSLERKRWVAQRLKEKAKIQQQVQKAHKVRQEALAQNRKKTRKKDE